VIQIVVFWVVTPCVVVVYRDAWKEASGRIISDKSH